MDFLSPGLKVQEIRKGPSSLQGVQSQSVGAFQGKASRGPVATPQKLTGFSDYLAVFGDPIDGGFLAEEVYAFFQNGGQFCYVSRQVHYTTISDPTSFDATTAQKQLQDGGSVNTILVKASSPGDWGNGYKVTTLRTSTSVTALAGTLAAAVAVTRATLSSTSRIRIGDLLEIKNGANSIIVTVLTISGNDVTFASTTPAAQILASGSVVNSLTFTLSAIRPNGTIDQQWTNLRMSALSSNYFYDVINNSFRTPFTVTDNLSVTADARPADTTTASLTGGSDGSDPDSTASTDYVGNAGAKNGLYAWDGYSDFGMLAVPGITNSTVVGGLIDYAESRQIFVAICDVPQGQAPQQAITYVTTTVNHYSSYAAFIYPWVKIIDPTGSKISAPMCGFWMGIIARTDANRGVWKAPAGIDDGQIRGIVGVDYSVQQPDYDQLYPNKINAVQSFPGEGTSVMGNITLDVTGEFGELNVRRLFLYVEQTLRVGLRWVNFEPNNKTTRARVVRNIRSFLKSIWQKEGLTGDKPDDAFFIVCDETNNDPVTISQRKLNIRIGLAPSHAAEFVGITTEIDTRAIDAAIAASV